MSAPFSIGHDARRGRTLLGYGGSTKLWIAHTPLDNTQRSAVVDLVMAAFVNVDFIADHRDGGRSRSHLFCTL
jgi:hypothetical protein